jgi:hypothetical protein
MPPRGTTTRVGIRERIVETALRLFSERGTTAVSVREVADAVLPLFVRVVVGSSATGAGQVLTPMMLAMMIGSASGVRLVLRPGYRTVCTSSMMRP